MTEMPIIHCLVDPEPTSFHASDATGKTATFAINLSFEIPAEQAGQTRLANDEAAAEVKLREALLTLDRVCFRIFRLKHPASVGAPFTLTYIPDLGQPARISAKNLQSRHQYVHQWLADEAQARQPPYWTSRPKSFRAGLVQDAERAGAAARLRAAQAWNAPAPHRQGLTHLLRFQPFAPGGAGQEGGGGDEAVDAIYVALPYFEDMGDKCPLVVSIVSAEGEDLGSAEHLKASDLADAAIECQYDVGNGLGAWICRTNAVGLVGGISIVVPPLTVPDDSALSKEGFLVVNKCAEEIRRFLKMFEERAASIMSAETSLHVDGEADADVLEKIVGFDAEQPFPNQDGSGAEHHWGATVWYVVTRLIAALDNHVLALLKPVADGSTWTFSPDCEGEVLAPLVSAIIDEIAEPDLPLDLDSGAVARAIRQVLRDNSPLVKGSKTSRSQLVNALKLVYGIGDARKITVKDEDQKDISLLDPDDPQSLVACMLATFQAGGNFDLPPDAAKPTIAHLQKEAKSISVLAATLLDIEQPLYDEAGAERTLVRLFETVELNAAVDGKPSDEERLIYRIAEAATNAGLPAGATRNAPSGTLVAAVVAGWTKYKALLDGPFNGAEAIRRAVSASFTDALLKDAGKGRRTFTIQELRDLTRGAQFYAWRLVNAGKRKNCFRVMALPLVKIESKPRRGMEELSKRLATAYTCAVAPLIAEPGDGSRFTPDSFPMPLPMQIASGMDGKEIDDFTKAFNGICVAIRRVDDGNSKWAYANLADLRWPQLKDAARRAKPDIGASRALHPMLPAVADGRSPMFIDYEGFPFADTAISARFRDDDASGVQKLFHGHEPHEFEAEEAFEKLPRLAYGRVFQSFSFAVSNAGVLPLGLQQDEEEPWLPNRDIGRIFKGKRVGPGLSCVGNHWYQRRTAIARMAVIEQPAVGEARRLGESIDGVHPLCADYPRLGVVADTDLPGVIDLFRDSDGVGRMHLPAKIDQPLTWRIDELEWSNAPSGLILRLFNRSPAGPGDAGAREIEIQGGDLAKIGSVQLEIKDEGDARLLRVLTSNGTTVGPVELTQTESSLWLRLEVSATTLVSLSFTDPEGKRSAGDAAPLILLRPDNIRLNVWRNELPTRIKVRVSTPRVGYLDFVRWMANSTLRSEAYTVGADEFERVLLIAYMMRHLDARLAQRLDNLPDPCVSAIRLELLATDRLTDDNVDVKAESVDLTTRLQRFVKEIFVNGEDSLPPLWTPELLLSRIFDPLDQRFSFTLELAAGDFALTNRSRVKVPGFVPTVIAATVPSGTVAQLSMHALVPKNLFEKTSWPDGEQDHPAVLHSGLKQFATRQTISGMLSYPATQILVETMYSGIDASSRDTVSRWIETAEHMIEAVPVAAARRFDLKTRDAHEVLERASAPDLVTLNDWRLIGEIDVSTQRWRPSGRPIYTFIKPRAFARKGVPVNGPALPIFCSKDQAVEQFEAEAFFDRPDIDAQTETKRLEPLGSRTVLQQFPWDSPSATYFRHRFALRSRYAGALLQETSRTVKAWPRGDLLRKEHAWTKRIVMLADASRLILTRPQLRALIPLTTAPGGERASTPTPTPPVAAILQERPYSRGGLADRIAPELKTGFGYGFEKGKPNEKGEETFPPVEILDSRKEIGPNPQLGYKAFNAESVLGLGLRGEGPMGLTFDLPDAPAPAFANTMLSLRPVSLTGHEPPFEEALMGVAMRRYLDPEWLATPPDSADSSAPVAFTDSAPCKLPADRTWWIEVGIGAEPTRLAGVTEAGTSLHVASVTLDNDFVEIKVWKESIDKVKGYKEHKTRVARADVRSIEGLALLHQPIAPGRYSTSVFARRKSRGVAEGDGSAPLMLASFEWSLPGAGTSGCRQEEHKEPLPPALLCITGPKVTACETMASATTSLRWTQISRDFDLVNVAGETTAFLAREVVARLENKVLRFDFVKGRADIAIRPSTDRNEFPSHIHRHIGFITSRYLGELGRPVEVFCGTALAGGPETVLFEDDAGSQAVRVVEFETPASILCDQEVLAPATYRTAYFDWVTTGYQGNDDLLLTLRFVGSKSHLQNFEGLTLILSQAPDHPGGTEARGTIDLPFEPAGHAWPVGARIFLRPRVTEPNVLPEAWIVLSDGTQRPVDTASTVLPLNLSGTLPGFKLALKSKGRGGEFWSDVSLLHCKQTDDELAAAKANPPGPAVAFHFEWLFGGVDGSSEPATQVGPARLAGMTEAQARIVSVSPPIPIAFTQSSGHVP